jgi:hypothetical protein
MSHLTHSRWVAQYMGASAALLRRPSSPWPRRCMWLTQSRHLSYLAMAASAFCSCTVTLPGNDISHGRSNCDVHLWTTSGGRLWPRWRRPC